jgi:hypothetical protein
LASTSTSGGGGTLLHQLAIQARRSFSSTKIKAFRFSVDSFIPFGLFLVLLFHPPDVIDFFIPYSMALSYPTVDSETSSQSSETRESFSILQPRSRANVHRTTQIKPCSFYLHFTTRPAFSCLGCSHSFCVHALHLLWAWSPQTGILPLSLIYYGIKYYVLALAVFCSGALLFRGLVGYLLGLFLVFVSILDSNFRKELVIFHDFHPRTPPFCLFFFFLINPFKHFYCKFK